MRLRPGALAEIGDELPGLLGARQGRLPGQERGVYLVELGAEAGLDTAACLSSALRALEFLHSRREELFGYNILIASRPPTADVEQRLRALLATAEQEEQVWLAPECVPLFASRCSLEEMGGLARVVALAQGPPPAERTAAPRWVREALVQKVLDALASRLNTGEGRDLLLVHGPSGAGKTTVMNEAARRLGVGGDFPILRLHTLFRRRSPLHPFITSIVPRLLADVPRHLRGPELAAWRETGDLFPFLLGSRRQDLFPDRLIADFAIAYGLYARAYVRMAAERLLPALVLCEGVESWHPLARRTAARLFEELIARPDFLPALSSTKESLPDEFAHFEARPVHIHPLGKREIRSFAQHLFPGLEIPESLARRLRRRSNGLSVIVTSYLQYLLKTGRIAAEAGGHLWVQSGEDEQSLPANPLSVSWFLIRSLHDDAFLLLYAIHLAGGLLDKEGLCAFLESAGFERSAIGRSLDGLIASGLMAEEELLIPRFPVLRKKLEELLGQQGARLKEQFIRHLFSLWEAGSFPHQVLLFSFLSKNGRTDLALRILPGIIGRKLDEGDPAGARAFCDPGRLEFAAALSPAERGKLSAVTTLGTLRAAVFEGNLEESSRAATAAARESDNGDALVACATHDLAIGDSASALERLKSALLTFQENGDERGERSAYLALGITMMGDGRTGEAAEYLGRSERLSIEASDPLGALRAGASLAGCLFVEGRYTRCLAEIEAAAGRARSIFQRGDELFLLFLKARVAFQFGAYEECGLLLQGCLTHASLYAIDAARPVLGAWLDRTVLYQGSFSQGIGILEKREQSREVLFFLAEGCLFAGDLENAFLYAERALAMNGDSRFPTPAVTGWRDGFSCIEGRCFRLSRNDALLHRSLAGLRAYLLGLRGFSTEAAGELRALTRGGKPVEEDPNAYVAHYLYSLVLPDSGSAELDDKATVLGKSLKGLQERASRIDAPAGRSAFLTRNLWSRRIMEDARARKLV
ncbi:MAG: ATP-binding protein [Spirochaetes bacterium]|nr:ATP-binding protein [Spirochaetota bacterium]